MTVLTAGPDSDSCSRSRFVLPDLPGIKIPLRSWRCGVFLLAICLYALVSSSTPDTPGLAEGVIGALLVLSVCPASVGALLFFSRQSFWQGAGRVFFLFGLVVPLVNGLLLQHYPPHLVLRDVIAFLFLCLPLFFSGLFTPRFVPQSASKSASQSVSQSVSRCVVRTKFRLLLLVIILAGVVLSARALAPVFALAPAPDELLYLANSPLVLFAALFLFCRAGRNMYVSLSWERWARALCLVGLGVLPVLALLIDMQRAGIGALIVTIFLLAAGAFVRRPRRALILWLVLAAAAVLLSSTLSDVAHELAFKTARVGLNMRYQEAQAVLEAAGRSWGTALFGHGWGAQYQSPAVGNLAVSYTHSLITYLLFKTGLCGLVLGLVYLGAIARMIARLVRTRPDLGLCLLWPFLIPVILYASYKSLDFGLILLLGVLAARAGPGRIEL